MNPTFLIAYDAGEATISQMFHAFGQGIKDRSVWSLQGSYGRHAAALIHNGYLDKNGDITELGYEHIERYEEADENAL